MPMAMGSDLLRSFFRQFAHPHGFWGRVVAWRLDISNRTANDWTLAQLGIEPGDRVLEVGFGSGRTLCKAALLAPQGLVAGVDSSDTMLELARRRCARLTAGRAEVKLGGMEAIPYPDDTFDKAYAVQVVNYLPDPLRGLRELRRVLRPAGRAALFFEPKEKFDRTQKWIARTIAGIYQPYAADEVLAMLRQSGFQNARCESTVIVPRLGYIGLCALGEK